MPAFVQDRAAHPGAVGDGTTRHAPSMSTLQELSISALDERPLAVRRFEPAGPARAQVLVHGATAVPQRFYAVWAAHLADRGLRTFTYDYRGIGSSRTLPLKDEPVDLLGWIDDATVVQRTVSDLDPALPTFLVGHSFGGQIAATLTPPAAAILLVGAQAGSVAGFPWPKRSRLRATMALGIPALTEIFGYVPAWAGLGEDLPGHVARQWARWCLSDEYYLGELPELRGRLARYAGPVLALSFTDDDFAPRANVQWLLDRLEGAAVEHRHLAPAELGAAGVGHFGFFRRAATERLWGFADAFFDRQLGLAPRLSTFEAAVHADLAYGRA
jgi:predicted alpha/beta hydrolase